ncbi:MAG TPA: hypothetical protein VII45_08560, partial [Solirubrobacterales bacterium]
IDASGNIWASYGLEGKVAEFNPTTGAVIREWGAEGSSAGQLKYAYRLAIGPEGNIWLSEFGNNRIQVFTPAGEYLYGFGSKGTGAGQFEGPRGTAFYGGRVYAVDGGESSLKNPRIEKWAMPTSQSGLTSTEITVDGTKVDSSSGCEAEGCSLSREWTLNSGSYSPGTHTVVAKAKDGAGHTTTKTQTIEIQRDTGSPQLAASGSLVEAPEGWVEQDGYAVTGSAPDAGYGTTQLKLMIDGKEVASSGQTCPDGGCSLSHTFSVNTAAYSGGAHPAELIATDGAGNTAKHKWTMNVDPEGHISPSEAEDTLEAVEATSPVNLIGEAQEEEEYEGTASGLGVAEVGEEIEATGTQVPTTVAANPAGGVTMQVLESAAFTAPCPSESTGSEQSEEGAEEELANGGGPEEPGPTPPCKEPGELGEKTEGYGLTPLQLTPVSVAVGAAETEITDETATLAANTSSHADTVVRPLYDGAMTFEAIRDSNAPETYSWEVNLESGQELKLVDDQLAEVYYTGGEHVAFGIVATPARDAIGTSVPTSLAVSDGNVVTLTVAHRGNGADGSHFIYPVIAGAGWQGGFKTYSVEMPPPEVFEEPIEEEEYATASATTGWGEEYRIGAPEATASASGGPTMQREFRRPYAFVMCNGTIHGGAYENPQVPPAYPNHVRANIGPCHYNPEYPTWHVVWGADIHGYFNYIYGNWESVDGKPVLEADVWGSDPPEKVDWFRSAAGAQPHHTFVLLYLRFPLGHLYPVDKGCIMFRGKLTIRPPVPDEPPWYEGWTVNGPRNAWKWPVKSGDPCLWNWTNPPPNSEVPVYSG